MINRIKKIANTEDKRRLLSNFFSLFILQGANYILPLITLPYLVRVLGVECFGILAFAAAMIAYFNIITDYGFNLTATREIAIHRNNREKVSEIFSSVMSIKFILMIVSFILMAVIVFSFEKFRAYWFIYFLTFGTVFGQVLFPVWFFQGMEKMKYITYLNILSKSIFTVAIFVFVHQASDFYIVPMLNSFGFIVAGVWSLFIIKKNFGIKFTFQRLDILKHYLKEGWHVFVASLSGNLYGQGNIIILGLFTSPIIVGYYSVALKISSAVAGLFQVVSQTIFPYLVKLKNDNLNKFKIFTKKIMIVLAIVNLTFIGSISLFSNVIYRLVSGVENYIGSYIFSFWLIITFATIFNVLFNPIIIALKQDSFMSKMYLFVGITFLMYGSLLTHLFSYNGMLYSMLLVELTIFILSIIAIKKGLLRSESI